MQDVIIGSDHAGFELKAKIKDYLREKKIFFVDVGCNSPDSADYPLIAKEVAECVISARHFCGILICGSGIGICIAANRFRGIRAALCHTTEQVRQAREHLDANVLCLAGKGDLEIARKIVHIFLNTKFTGEERYKKRIALLDK